MTDEKRSMQEFEPIFHELKSKLKEQYNDFVGISIFKFILKIMKRFPKLWKELQTMVEERKNILLREQSDKIINNISRRH